MEGSREKALALLSSPVLRLVTTKGGDRSVGWSAWVNGVAFVVYVDRTSRMARSSNGVVMAQGHRREYCDGRPRRRRSSRSRPLFTSPRSLLIKEEEG